MFLFAGTAELHLIDMHPKIVLVAPVGGIEDTVFGKTHCLDVIEPRATGCSTSNRVAPVIDSTAGNCCQRHRSLLLRSTVPFRDPGRHFPRCFAPEPPPRDSREEVAADAFPVNSRRPVARKCR